MIISHKHKYIFIGLPFSGSSVISKELIELYDGESIYNKHTNIQSILNVKEIDITNFFVFAVYRDPVEICKSVYSKYITNAKGVFTDKKFLVSNGGHISDERIKKYNFIKTHKLDFNGFIKYTHKNGFKPYDSVFTLNEKYLDFKINFNSLNKDFKLALSKIGIKPKRDLPIYNKTKNKIEIDYDIDLGSFEPFYLRGDNLFKPLKEFRLKLFLMRIFYHVLHPLRKWKWLQLDKNRTGLRDEYFHKLN